MVPHSLGVAGNVYDHVSATATFLGFNPCPAHDVQRRILTLPLSSRESQYDPALMLKHASEPLYSFGRSMDPCNMKLALELLANGKLSTGASPIDSVNGRFGEL